MVTVGPEGRFLETRFEMSVGQVFQVVDGQPRRKLLAPQPRPITVRDRDVFTSALTSQLRNQGAPPPVITQFMSTLSFGELYPAFGGPLSGPEGTARALPRGHRIPGPLQSPNVPGGPHLRNRAERARRPEP